MSELLLKKKEYTGSSVSYYRVKVLKPTSKDLPPYEAECNDIIKALQMNFAEGNAFKAIWRSCAARHLGLGKEGYKDGLYDAEKVVFFGGDMVEQAVTAQIKPPIQVAIEQMFKTSQGVDNDNHTSSDLHP